MPFSLPLVPATAAVLAALSAVVLAQPATAAPSCLYDSDALAVMATLDAGDSATLEVGADGEIRFGASPDPCGVATTENTDSILVAGPTGSTEHLVIDQFGGLLAPGATPEAEGRSEIEVRVELGDDADEIVVQGSPDEAPLAVGTKGVAFNADTDVDITFSPLPASIELVAADGMPHVVTARGGYGSGRVFPGPVTLRAGDLGDSLTGSDFADLLLGGNGPDLIHGSPGNDTIDGGAGSDRLRGSDGNDSISGGLGADIFAGGFGNDALDAHEGVADLQLHGGPGADAAVYDRGLDPVPVAVEARTALDPPPLPDPVTDCDFAAGVVTATIAPGARATLAVRSGLIHFDPAAEGCGGATTTNTDRVSIIGSSETGETFVLDLRGGRLGPGLSPETTGRSEIEVVVDLQGGGDVVRVRAPHSHARFTVGSRGIALNADDDVDVIVDPTPRLVALVGGRGRDRLSAAGGYGAGRPFAGRVVLEGAGSADRLVGGPGRDVIRGGPGSDLLIGGGRADVLSGGPDNDLLRAVDGLRDLRVDGDGGRDTAYYDRGRDLPAGCEVLHPRGGWSGRARARRSSAPGRPS